MTKFVISNCYGGFGLSNKAISWLEEYKAFNTPELKEGLERTKKWIKDCNESGSPDDMMLKRDNPLLVQCIETLGREASNECARLVVAEEEGKLDEDFFIGNYDGLEFICYSYEEAEARSNQI